MKKVKLTSKLFQQMYEKYELEIKDEQPLNIVLSIDEKLPYDKSEQEKNKTIQDYLELAYATKAGIESASFSSIGGKFVEHLLKLKPPTNKLSISNTYLDLKNFRGNINLKNIEELSFTKITAVPIEKAGDTVRFDAIKDMSNLKKLDIADSPTLNLDKLMDDIPYPEKVEEIGFEGNLPDTESLSKFTNLESIFLRNIKDSEKLSNFLNKLPLEKLKIINIAGSDLSMVNEKIVSKLKNLDSMFFIGNTNIDYNAVLDNLQCQNTLQRINFTPAEEYSLDLNKLQSCEGLKGLILAKMNIENDKFKPAFSKLQNLENLLLSNMPVDLNALESLPFETTVSLSDTGNSLDNITQKMVRTTCSYKF
jgi:hypothetical protein